MLADLIKIRLVRYKVCMGESNVYNILVGKSKEITFEETHRWWSVIKMDWRDSL
jgi:hypothetical protein